MTTCPLQNDNAEALLDYIARKLKPEPLAIFERHIASCAECRAFAEQQRAVWNALDLWDPETVSADFDDQLYARIAQEGRPSWLRRAWGRFTEPGSAWPKAVPLAAACATVAVTLFLYAPQHQRATTVPVKAEAVDLDQVERALDDLEMLKQLSPKDAQNL